MTSDQIGRNARILNDQPISSSEADRFSRSKFAERIAKTIIERRDSASLVIGLMGPWGSGKTSILRLMLDELRHYKYVGRTVGGAAPEEKLEPVVVQFNPWYFTDESHLIRSFFNTLSDSLDASTPSTRAKIGNALKQYGRIVSPLTKAIDPVLTVLGAIVPGVSLAGKANDMFKDGALEALGETLSPSLAGLDSLREQVNTALRESDRRVVVLVDDIDRLDLREIQAVFKLMKLSADFERITYVVAFDPEIVSAALAQSYADDKTAGNNFLEKIVQIPLYLPASSASAYKELVFDGIDEVMRVAEIPWRTDDRADFRRHFGRGFAARLLTPRAAKRYVMAVEFVLPLLIREVHPVDFMLIEAFRLFYPRIYALVRDNPEMFLVGPEAYMSGPAEHMAEIEAEGEREAEKFNAGLSDLSYEERMAVMSVLVRLFPQIRSDEYSFTGEDNDGWAAEQRIASGMYFYRYFQYAVPSGDITDQGFYMLLDDLPSLDLDSLVERLRNLAMGQRAERLVTKLSSVRLSIPIANVPALARGLARLGNDVPRPEPVPEGQYITAYGIARLCSELVQRLPRGDERDQLAAQIVAEATSPVYAVDLWDELRSDRYSLPRRPVVSEAAASKIDTHVAGMIRDAASVALLHQEFGHEAPDVYEAWARYSSSSDVQAVIMPVFERDPSQAGKFVSAYLQVEIDELSGAQRRGRISRRQFERISQIVDPNILAAFLRQAYPLVDTQPARLPQSRTAHSDDEKAAQQFMDQLAQLEASRSEGSQTET